jgi:hypothetical protein
MEAVSDNQPSPSDCVSIQLLVSKDKLFQYQIPLQIAIARNCQFAVIDHAWFFGIN